jgi:hypothetical protein
MPRIACLSWGSLIWHPKDLPVVLPWIDDGPEIRVEFLRESRDSKCLTLILHATGARVRSLWAEIKSVAPDAAKRALRAREGCASRDIGLWTNGNDDPLLIEGLSRWAAEHQIDAVVWTALGPRHDDQQGISPTLEQALAYLRGLPDSKRKDAEDYIRYAHIQIDTPYRQRIAEEFEWTPLVAPATGEERAKRR